MDLEFLRQQVLQKISGKTDYVFNPIGWVMDEAGAWWNGVKEVYGDDGLNRAVSCEFHYKQSVRRQSTKLPAGNTRDQFESLGYGLLKANTVSMFEKSRADSTVSSKKIPERERERP